MEYWHFKKVMICLQAKVTSHHKANTKLIEPAYATCDLNLFSSSTALRCELINSYVFMAK